LKIVRPQLVLKIAICAGLVALIFAVFGQTLGHGFVNFDDPPYVSENPQIQLGISWANILWAFTHVHSHNWHPLTTISHMLDCQLFGLKPGAHHLVNVLLHTASTILLFIFLTRATSQLWPSAFVAAIFSIHPLHVESVAWIAERKDVLSGLFFMLTLLAYLRYSRKPGFWRYLVMSMLFACGLMSKPMLVTLPVILLLLDYWPLKRVQSAEGQGQSSAVRADWSRVGSLVLEKVPLFLLAVASVIATLIAQRGGIAPTDELPVMWRITNALSAYVIYIWQTIWPAHLALMYPHPGRLPAWQSAGAALILIVITAGAFVLRRRCPYWITGWFWYLIMLLPVIGLIQVGSQAHADRYMYLPQVGICVVATWGIADLLRPLAHRGALLSVAAPVVLVLFAGRAWIQTSYWHDTERLWNQTLSITRRNDIAHFNMGEFLLKAHRLDEAIAQFDIFVRNHPKDPNIHYALGSAFMEKGELGSAFREFQRTLELQPDDSQAETNLANVLLKADRLDEAVEHYRNVVQRQPGSALAQYNLAVGLHRQGRLTEAIVHYKEALRIDPNYPDAASFLAQALLENGQPEEARFYMQKP
jgi:tetratricopeptide (TPR) repeat protein